MKKYTAFLLVLTLVLSLTACGSKEADYIPVHPLDAGLGLSDSVLDGQIAIEGVVYQMPIPVSELVANGWNMDVLDMDMEPHSYTMVSFKKEDLRFDTLVSNQYSSNTHLSQCHVVEATFGPQTTDTKSYYSSGRPLINVQFTSGLNISSSEEDLIGALGQPADSSLTWAGPKADRSFFGVEFSAQYNKDGTLFSFTLQYLPADFQP